MITHEIRDIKTGKLKSVKLTRASAIKYFCLECCGGDRECIRNCEDKNCPLYPFRPFKIRVKKPQKKGNLKGKFTTLELFKG